ncbi:MAG TPA: NnrS family protein [Anaerolineae bacterium]|nr:NnrS family protein [Anaerolineae bacterium]
MSAKSWTQTFHEPFIYGALAIALTAGFGYGALIVGSVALGVIPGAWWGAVVQAHGHAQLFGWLGLFVLGMGLYFLPRLHGATLQETARLPYVLGLMSGGIALRVIAQPWLGFRGASDAFPLLQFAWALSAVLEVAGMLVLFSMLRATERVEKPVTAGSPAYASERFVRIAFGSLGVALLFNALGVWNAVAQERTTLAPYYDNLVITLILYGAAIPMAIVFSIRNLPLFLRLALPPRDSLRRLGVWYAASLLWILAPWLLAIADDLLMAFHRSLLANDLLASLLNLLQVVGTLALNLAILVFVWQLDLLRRRAPWVVNRAPNTRPDLDYLRKPTRENYPDAGEYGRFELLIYSAYGWLVVAVILNIGRVFGDATGWVSISADAARHALTVGFITLLIFGMAARMVPGFSHKKGVAYPRLVTVTFALGNVAAFLRVVPTLFPSWELALPLLGLSGAFGWLAVAVLAVNLHATFRRA